MSNLDFSKRRAFQPGWSFRGVSGACLVRPRWSLIILAQFWEIMFLKIFRLSRISCAHEIDDCRTNSGARSCLRYRINFLICHRDGLRSHLGPGSIKISEILTKNDVLLQVAFWPLVAPRPNPGGEGFAPLKEALPASTWNPSGPGFLERARFSTGLELPGFVGS